MNTATRRCPAVLLVLGLLALGACQGSRPQGGEVSVGFPAPDQELVYHYALEALGRQGYSPDLEASDPKTGVVVTRWKPSLQPFSGQGYREQATVTIHPVPERAGYFTTETQVIRQQNDNMVDPGNLLAAQWSGGQRVPDVEQLINSRIEMNFLPSGLSPEFRQRYGLKPTPDTRIPPPPVR